MPIKALGTFRWLREWGFDPARSQVKNYTLGSPCGPALCLGYNVTFVFVIRVTLTG